MSEEETQFLETVETVEEIDVTAKEWIQQQSDKEVVKFYFTPLSIHA
jgi:hypothetical protein